MSTTRPSGTHQGSLRLPRIATSPARKEEHGGRSQSAVPPRLVGPPVGFIESVGSKALRLPALWHLLSLDAPTVAAVWVVFIASSAGLGLRWTEPVAMFVAVWMLYAADRLLDARAVDTDGNQQSLEARHRFHDRHRIGFSIGVAVALPSLLWLLRDTSPAVLRLDLVLGILLTAWLLIVHRRPVLFREDRLSTDRLPKELAVGLFFPAAVFIPTVARLPALRPALLPVAFLFAAVCTLNCLYIFAWEHPPGRRHAHSPTQWAVEHLPQLTIVVFSAAVAAALLAVVMHGGSQAPRTLPFPALACAASAALLLLVHHYRDHMTPLLLRASADLCLLTPALLLPAF